MHDLMFNKICTMDSVRTLGNPKVYTKPKVMEAAILEPFAIILIGSENSETKLSTVRVSADRTTKLLESKCEYLLRNILHVWATDAEIMAIANLLSCNIVIQRKVSDSMDWVTYPTSFHLHALSKPFYLEKKLTHFNGVLSI